MKRSVIAFLVAAMVAGSLAAQSGNASPAKLVESVDVRVINIDVVVTDRKGVPVHGLKASDFEISENGRQQPITNFYEVDSRRSLTPPAPEAPATTTAPAAPAPTPAQPERLERRFIFYIDNVSLAPFNRNRVFKSMKKFINDTMQPGDSAMIATWNRSMKVRVPFTSDKPQLLQTLDSIAGETAMGMQNLAERREYESRLREMTSYSEAIATARQYAQAVQHDVRENVNALNALMSTLAGVEGKKVLVLTTEGLQLTPGKELFYFLDEIKQERPEWMSAGGSAGLEASLFDSTALVKTVASTANANGITLYTLHAGGLDVSSGVSADTRQADSYSVTSTALSNSTDALRMLADETGGRATVGTNNFGDAFARIQTDLDSYYSLGYRATTERIDRQRSVDVRTKNRALVVRSRKSYVEKSVATEMNDRVIANLFYPTKVNDLKITVITGAPAQVDGDHFKVPVEVRIPMTSLTFLPQGELELGQFSVFVASSNKDGDTSDVVRQSKQLSLKHEEISKLGGKYYAYTFDLMMEKGRNKISIGVVDDVTNVAGFDRREVIAADLR